MRKELHDLLASVVRARIEGERLKYDIIYEMQKGYRPTYRGHEWGREHFVACENVFTALEAAFSWLKWLQFPEIDSRREEAAVLSGQVDAISPLTTSRVRPSSSTNQP